MTCAGKECEVKIKMIQEDQPEVKFLLGFNMKIVI